MSKKTKQRIIYKINTSRLKQSNWELKVDVETSKLLEERVALADSQLFRHIRDMTGSENFDEYLCCIVADTKTDFDKIAKKGFTLVVDTKDKHGKEIVKKILFKRFVGTTGGLKNDSCLFVNGEIIDELNERCECGRNPNVKILPAKYEAYKSLTCSSSTEIVNPNGVLVVRDCINQYKGTVLNIDDTRDDCEPIIERLENIDLENNVSDGFNLITPSYAKRISEHLGLDYIPSGFCIRNAWCKGMANVFDIQEFAKRFSNGNYLIEDVWGKYIDIRNVEMILTESSLKLWMCYDSVEDYLDNCKRCGYNFSITKATPKILEDERTLNYQYLQSYEFSDDDIQELIKPTIEWLKKSMGGDYESTLSFLGVDKDTFNMDYTKALALDERMLKDPYVIDRVNRLIRKKVDQAKIGKLFVKGNYQTASGDPYALMQSIFNIEVTGLLKENQCYSKYWSNINEDKILAFRSPMTSHNNIRELEVVANEEVDFWYGHMGEMIIINGWDTFCMAENGEDWD